MTVSVEADRAAQQGLAAGRTALLPVVGAELAVPLVAGGTVRYANLDYAASAPALESVAARVQECLAHYSSVHRGAGWPSVVSTALYEEARETVARFVGARPADAVVFTRNTTDALNLLASALPPGGHVVHLDAEHHGNLLSWQRCAHTSVAVAGTVGETLAALGAALAAVRGRPTLLSITGAGNVTGEMPPLDEVAALARAHGARLAVDGAQLVPHRRIAMAVQGIDYLAFSGHKLYAPFGAGVLIGRRDWLDAAAPYLRGGGAVHEVGRSEVRWADAPARHEGGTPNLVGAVALAAACDALAALAHGRLRAHEQALTSRLDLGLAELPEISTLRMWPEQDGADRVAVRSFVLEGRDPARVAAYLSAEHGIGVRHGRFCAHQLVSRLIPQDTATRRAAPAQALRASLGAGSTVADVDRLVAALHELVERGESWSYARQDGQWVPEPDPRTWGPARGSRGSGAPCGT